MNGCVRAATMEHRCGERFRVGSIVRLTYRASGASEGILRDVSISGGFIETDLKLPERARVDIDFVQMRGGVAERRCWFAHVVRAGCAGLAVEWCEATAEDVLSLIVRSATRDGRRVRKRLRRRSEEPQPEAFSSCCRGGS